MIGKQWHSLSASVSSAVVVMALVCAAHVTVLAQSKGADISDEIEQSQKAGRVFNEIMGAPDRAIPQNVLEDAHCVAVFPSVIKAAFGIGGRGGRGVASCRTADGWSDPAYFNLGGGSFGFQIGVEATDLVMLFMTDSSINSLLSSKFELGGDASVAAGPVGRQAGASTDLKFNSQILSYSRNKGVFAGVALKGAVIEQADGDTRDVYGEGVTAKAVLRDGKRATTAAIRAFPESLSRHSARRSSR